MRMLCPRAANRLRSLKPNVWLGTVQQGAEPELGGALYFGTNLLVLWRRPNVLVD
jgi:hypothetical protein